MQPKIKRAPNSLQISHRLPLKSKLLLVIWRGRDYSFKGILLNIVKIKQGTANHNQGYTTQSNKLN
jgi:hypothetical protein